MASDYEITAITPTDVAKASGGYEAAYEYHYTTMTTPPITGTVTVPKTNMADANGYAAEVHAAIEAEVAAHKATLAHHRS